MSRWGLFEGRFDHDPADCFWTERDGPPAGRCERCDGRGGVEVNGQWSPCSECVGMDICPECGQAMETDVDAEATTCPACGWQWSW